MADKKKHYTSAIRRKDSGDSEVFTIPCNCAGISVSDNAEAAIRDGKFAIHGSSQESADDFEVIAIDVTNLVKEGIITRTIGGLI